MAWMAKGQVTPLTRQHTDWINPARIAVLVFTVLIAACWSQAGASQSFERRVALVIGNSSYVSAPALPNPANDARAMSDTLRRLGFIVQEGIDLDAAGMESTLRAFGAAAEAADVALVFYAGHGIQVDGTNYLLPVDVTLNRERDLNYEAVSLDLILSEVSQADKLAVVILDACRDNPFAGQLQAAMGPTRSAAVGRGLGRVDAPADTLVAFATRDGAVADDGDGANSPYTAALLQHLDEPDLEIGHYFRKVRDTVIASTRGRQEPFVYGSLSAQLFFFNPGSKGGPQQMTITVPIVPGPPAAGLSTVQGTSGEIDRLFWESIRQSTNRADFEAYLRQFPDGVFAALARNRLDMIAARDEVRPTAAVPERTETALLMPPPPTLSHAERREAQIALNRLGLYNGVIDAIHGPGTRAGVAEFQRSIGVTADGRLTAEQLARLREAVVAVPEVAAQSMPEPTATAEAPAAPPHETATGSAYPPQLYDPPTRTDGRHIQTSLQRLGFYAGTIDGEFDRGTRDAIIAFQQSLGDDPIGILTRQQMIRLHRQAAEAQLLQGTQTASVNTPVANHETDEVGNRGEAATGGNFGAIARGTYWWGVCVNRSSQEDANACAMADCGSSGCRLLAEFGSGQCAATNKWGEFTAVGTTRSEVLGRVRQECRNRYGQYSDECSTRQLQVDCNS